MGTRAGVFFSCVREKLLRLMLRLPSSFQVSGSAMLEGAGEALAGVWDGREEGPTDCITGMPELMPLNKSCDGCAGVRLSPPRRSRLEAGGCIKGGMDVGAPEDIKGGMDVGAAEDRREALVGVTRGFMAGDMGAEERGFMAGDMGADAKGLIAGDMGADAGRGMLENKSTLLLGAGAAAGIPPNKSWLLVSLPPPPNADEKSANPSFSLLLLKELSLNAVGKPGTDGGTGDSSDLGSKSSTRWSGWDGLGSLPLNRSSSSALLLLLLTLSLTRGAAGEETAGCFSPKLAAAPRSIVFLGLAAAGFTRLPSFPFATLSAAPPLGFRGKAVLGDFLAAKVSSSLNSATSAASPFSLDLSSSSES